MIIRVVYKKSKTELPITCPLCGDITTVKVDALGFEAWLNGALIQEALPEESPTTRETLISGLCTSCQSKIFGRGE